MPERLMICECPLHGLRSGAVSIRDEVHGVIPCPDCKPARVFREEDVRPVVASVEGLLGLLDETDHLATDAEWVIIVAARQALRMFPAPGGWKAAAGAAERCECGVVSRGLVDGVCAGCRDRWRET